jgi:hypothetical protein
MLIDDVKLDLVTRWKTYIRRDAASELSKAAERWPT